MTSIRSPSRAQHQIYSSGFAGLDHRTVTALGQLAGIFDGGCRWHGLDRIVEISRTTTAMISVLYGEPVTGEEITLLVLERLALLGK